MMREDGWLGIDLGTQSVKVVVFDNSGAVVAKATRPFQSIRGENTHEQSPQSWKEETFTCLREVTSTLPKHYRVRALSTCATSGTITVANKSSMEIRPRGVMYDDTRGAKYRDTVNELGRNVWARLGYSIQDSWALPSMLWWQDEELLGPDDVFITQADVIHWALAGIPLPSDTSHTLKSGFDLDRMEWPEEVLTKLGLPIARLNPVVAPGLVIGKVSAEVARETGLDQGTAIVSGMTDGSAAQIAAGAVKSGSWNSVLGTTLVLKGANTHKHHDPSGSIYCHLAPFSSGWWPGGASNTGTRALDLIPVDTRPSSLKLSDGDIISAAVEYPLVGVGERFPFVFPGATGFVLSEDSGPIPSSGNRFASLALGVAMVERLCFDVVQFAGYHVDGAIRFTGGGSANPDWNRLRSTVLGHVALVPAEAGSAAGMAILARAGLESFSPKEFMDITESMVSVASTFEPEPGLSGAVTNKYFTLVDEFFRREWISNELAEFVRRNL